MDLRGPCQHPGIAGFVVPEQKLQAVQQPQGAAPTPSGTSSTVSKLGVRSEQNSRTARRRSCPRSGRRSGRGSAGGRAPPGRRRPVPSPTRTSSRSRRAMFHGVKSPCQAPKAMSTAPRRRSIHRRPAAGRPVPARRRRRRRSRTPAQYGLSASGRWSGPQPGDLGDHRHRRVEDLGGVGAGGVGQGGGGDQLEVTPGPGGDEGRRGERRRLGGGEVGQHPGLVADEPGGEVVPGGFDVADHRAVGGQHLEHRLAVEPGHAEDHGHLEVAPAEDLGGAR